MKGSIGHPPKICIGIPVYNGGAYLREALDSLLVQNYKEFQIVVINDGSTDHSDSIVREFVARDQRIHYFPRTVRRGMILTWREAFERAWGLFEPDYFAWHGDHDKVAPDWLSSLVAAMILTPELSCAYARSVCLSAQGEILPGETTKVDTGNLDLWGRLYFSVNNTLGSGDIVYGLFRSEVLRKCGVFREEIFPDKILVVESGLHGSLRYVGETTRYRRVFGAAPTGAQLMARQMDTLFLPGTVKADPCLSHASLFLRQALSNEFSENPEARMARHMLGVYFFVRESVGNRDIIELEAKKMAGSDLDVFKQTLEFHHGGCGLVLHSDFLGILDEKRELLRRLESKMFASKIQVLKSRIKKAFSNLRQGLRYIKMGGEVLSGRIHRIGGQVQPLRVLYVTKKSVRDKGLFFHGSTKDRYSRIEYFRERGIPYVEYHCRPDDKTLWKDLERFGLKGFGAVLIDIPGAFLFTIRHIKKAHPKIKVIFRSHNAEFLHRLDWARACQKWGLKLSYFRAAFQNLIKDSLLTRFADAVLPISDWDCRGYWKKIGGLRNSLCVPYYLSRIYLKTQNHLPKQNICVCFGSAAGGPLTHDAIREFDYLVSNLKGRLPGWRFVLTGENKMDTPVRPPVENIGFLSSPQPLLAKARVVAVLSSYGRGFKTKILDVIAAKAFVLVPPKLYERLPEVVRPFCLVVRPGSVEDFVKALRLSEERAFPPGNPNIELKNEAFAAMDKALGVPSSSPLRRAEEATPDRGGKVILSSGVQQ